MVSTANVPSCTGQCWDEVIWEQVEVIVSSKTSNNGYSWQSTSSDLSRVPDTFSRRSYTDTRQSHSLSHFPSAKRYSTFFCRQSTRRCADKIPTDKIPTDKIPMDKFPTTGFRCGCPDFLDFYMHAWFGPMVHVYIHTITMQSCLMHPTLLC